MVSILLFPISLTLKISRKRIVFGSLHFYQSLGFCSNALSTIFHLILLFCSSRASKKYFEKWQVKKITLQNHKRASNVMRRIMCWYWPSQPKTVWCKLFINLYFQSGCGTFTNMNALHSTYYKKCVTTPMSVLNYYFENKAYDSKGIDINE